MPSIQAPHYRFLGGLGAHEAKPLPNELENYVNSAGEHGVIVLSFGSGISRLSCVLDLTISLKIN